MSSRSTCLSFTLVRFSKPFTISNYLENILCVHMYMCVFVVTTFTLISGDTECFSSLGGVYHTQFTHMITVYKKKQLRDLCEYRTIW